MGRRAFDRRLVTRRRLSASGVRPGKKIESLAELAAAARGNPARLSALEAAWSVKLVEVDESGPTPTEPGSSLDTVHSPAGPIPTEVRYLPGETAERMQVQYLEAAHAFTESARSPGATGHPLAGEPIDRRGATPGAVGSSATQMEIRLLPGESPNRLGVAASPRALQALFDEQRPPLPDNRPFDPFADTHTPRDIAALPGRPWAEIIARHTAFGSESGASGVEGQIIEIAGTTAALYAIGAHGALWKWDRDPGRPWRRLPGAPEAARWIAVDPDDPEHIFIGTRRGLRPGDLNDAGLWDSTDGGESNWQYLLNPPAFAGPGEPRYQEILGLAVDSNRTLYAATNHGLIRIDYPHRDSAPGLSHSGYVRAVAANQLRGAERRLWALTGAGDSQRLRVCEGEDNGSDNWKSPWPLPATFPSMRPAEWLVNVDFTRLASSRPLAAVGDSALLFGVEVPDDYKIVFATSNRRDDWQYKQATSLSLRTTSGQPTLKSFMFRRLSRDVARQAEARLRASQRPRLNPRPVPTRVPREEAGLVGDYRETWQFCCSRQNIAARLRIDRGSDDPDAPGGQPDLVLETEWVVISATDVTLPNFPEMEKDHHVDLWDVHMDADRTIWVSCDGGITRSTTARPDFVTWDEGLFAHQINGLALGPQRPGAQSLAYGAFDNGGFSSSDGSNFVHNAGGDAGQTLGDSGCASAWIQRGNLSATLVPNFGQSLYRVAGMEYLGPPSSPFPISKKHSVRAIQSLDGEVAPDLDLIQLFEQDGNPGYTDQNDRGVKSILAKALLGGGGVGDKASALLTALRNGRQLVRLRKYTGDAVDWNGFWASYVSNPKEKERLESAFPWEVVAALPPDTSAIWVSGGHAAPVFYALGADGTVWRLARYAPIGDTQFVPLKTNGARGTSILGFRPTIIGRGDNDLLGSFDTLFVDPYRPAHLVFFGREAGAVQILHSQDYGQRFAADFVLRALVTASGQFLPDSDRLTGYFDRYRIVQKNNLSSVAFLKPKAGQPDRDAETLAAAGVYGGLFFRGPDRRWRDLSWLLPSQDTFVSALEITDAALYAATWGHGLWKISNYRAAPLATFFDFRVLDPKVNPGLDHVPPLLDADERPVINAAVWVQARPLSGVYVDPGKAGAAGAQARLLTDGEGKVPVDSLGLRPGRRYVFRLTYGGKPLFPPGRAEISYLFDVK